MATAEYYRKWRQENKERCNLYRRKYYAENKEKLKEQRRRYYKNHKPEFRARTKRWEVLNPEAHKIKQNRQNKRRYREYQRKVLYHYSKGTMFCAYCGFSDIRALSLDHINGGGEEARRAMGGGGHQYRWLIKNNYPEGIQVLCMNCQFIKRYTNNEFPNQPNNHCDEQDISNSAQHKYDFILM